MSTEPLNLPARSFELPRALSEQARAILGMNYANRQFATLPALDDPAGWTSFVAQREALLKDQVTAFLAVPGATLEERDLGAAKVWVATPDTIQPGAPKVQYSIHGGGWVFGGGRLTAVLSKLVALASGGVVHGVDYRMPPTHPYPAALDDCLAGYRALLETYSPSDILVSGQSAGGNLAAAMMLRARDEGLPKPAALFLDTPAVDLTMASDSLYTNEGLDSAIGIDALQGGLLYAGGHDVAHPYLSPIHGDVSDAFPPTYLRTGTRDLLLSDTVRLHARLRKAGVEADLYVVEGMPHGGFDAIMASTPEDQDARADLLRWVESRF